MDGILMIEGEPAAGYLCVRERGVLYTLKTSYKKKFASPQYSPGIVLLHYLLRSSWLDELTTIDYYGSLLFANRWASGQYGYGGLIAYRNGIYGSAIYLADRIRRGFGTGLVPKVKEVGNAVNTAREFR